MHGLLQALEAELRRLKLELKQTLEAYNSACREAVIAKQKTEAEDRGCNRRITNGTKASRYGSSEEKNSWKRAKQEAEEKKRALMGKKQNSVGFHHRRYSIQDIEVATNYYDDSYKIGEGGYGPVFRGTLDHTPVAIKVLRPNISQLHKQFKQEVHYFYAHYDLIYNWVLLGMGNYILEL